MSNRSKKVIIAGFDSLHARLLRQMVKEGILKNFEYIMKNGYVSDVLPVTPAQTPSGWASIATGAWPGTHGVTGFSVIQPGKPLNERVDGFDSRVCIAETLWEAAENAGKKVILIKYPGTWPPKIKKGIQIDGHAGYAGRVCRFAIITPKCFVTKDSTEHMEAGGEADDLTIINFVEAKEWKNLPQTSVKPLEAHIELEDRHGNKVLSYDLLVYGDNKYEKVAICKGKDLNKAICILKPGEWSNWVIEEVVTEGRRIKVAFKFKLIYLSEDAKRFRLYMHQAHAIEGMCVPESLCKELLENVGPFYEYIGCREIWEGWFDLDTQLEIYREHTEWLIKAIKYLAKKHKWDLLAFQWHAFDYAFHICWAGIDEKHPVHVPEKKEKCWKFVKEVFKLADEIIGAVLEIMDDNTVLAVIGDHGHVRYHTKFLLGNYLMKHGLIAVKKTEDGNYVIDWSKTKVFPVDTSYIYINLKGREVTGIVDPSEYESLREQVIKLLYSVKNPETGECPFLFVIKKEDARALGLYGERVGDIVYCLREGYETAITPIMKEELLKPGEEIYFLKVKPFRGHTSEHSGFIFHEDLNTLLILYGSGIRKGYERKVPLRLVDLAPTLAYLMGIPKPKHAEGLIIWDALEE